MVVDTSMLMSHGATTGETDDLTLQSHQQWSAYLAQHDQQLAATQKQLEECIRNSTSTCPPATIDTTSNSGDQKRRQGPLSNGPEGVMKITKFYKNCENACWLCGYDVSKLHDSGNYKKKKPGHIDSYTGANPQPGASQKDKEFLKWK